MIGLQEHAIESLQHFHGGMCREQIDHQALMRGIEMLDENERDAAAGGQRSEQRGAGFQPACGCADADHRKSGIDPGGRPRAEIRPEAIVGAFVRRGRGSGRFLLRNDATLTFRFRAKDSVALLRSSSE
jgi:hypothetical protein